MTQHKPFSESEAERKQRQQPANRIKAIDRQRFSLQDVEREIARRRRSKTYYENR